MKKILITGGTGFVGQYLVSHLQSLLPMAQLHLTSLTGSNLYTDNSSVIVHSLDLTQAKAVSDLIKTIQPDQIYHLASIASVGDSFKNPESVVSNNFTLTLNLLEAVRLFSKKSKILLVSSADIYDKKIARPIDETCALDPASPYAASKAAQDLLAGSYVQSFGLSIVRARPFNHFGAGQGKGFVVADFASQIATLEQQSSTAVIRVGNLTASRDFTDVRDIVRAYVLLMDQGLNGEVYNLGSGQAVTISSLLEILISQARVPIKVEIDPNLFRPVDLPLVVADISKISGLGWSPQIPLSQTLGEVLDFWRGIITL